LFPIIFLHRLVW